MISSGEITRVPLAAVGTLVTVPVGPLAWRGRRAIVVGLPLGAVEGEGGNQCQ